MKVWVEFPFNLYLYNIYQSPAQLESLIFSATKIRGKGYKTHTHTHTQERKELALNKILQEKELRLQSGHIVLVHDRSHLSCT